MEFLQIPFESEDRKLFYQEHMERIRTYTAVFAVSDYYAAELMRFLGRAGIRVSEDISVVGFDNTLLCDQVYPPLTSVKQDIALRAGQAVHALARLKEGNTDRNVIRLPVSLVVRESVKRLH